MYHKPTRRQQQIKLFLTYSLMVTAVIAIVTVLVLLIQGYRYDGKIERDGLVQFESRPSGATVSIDGRTIRSKTAARTTLPEGVHDFTISRTGYRTWQKTENLVGGSVLWLNYARLIPEELTAKSVADLENVSDTLASLDDETFAALSFNKTLTLDLYDIRGDTVDKKDFAIDSDKITASEDAKQQFSLERWSGDSRYLLVRHSFDKKSEWLVVDTRSEKDNVVNINNLLGVSPTKVEFRPGNARQLYLLEQQNLRRADLGSQTLTGPIARVVDNFSVADDGLVTFTATQQGEDTALRSIGYVSDGTTTSQILRTFTNSDEAVKVASGRYFSQRYIALVTGQKLEILKADLADSNSKNGKSSLTLVTTEELSSGEVLDVTLRAKGRFAIIQFTDSFATYDLELEKFSTTKLDGQPNTAPLSWLDAYTLWRNSGDTLKAYEFDGQNAQSLLPAEPGQDVTLSPNGKYLYTVSKSDDGPLRLNQIRLILN